MTAQSLLERVFDPALCVALLECLLHFLWQASLLGLIAYLSAVCLRGYSARIRYAVDLSCLLLVAACLPVTFTWTGLESAGKERISVATRYRVSDAQEIVLPPITRGIAHRSSGMTQPSVASNSPHLADPTATPTVAAKRHASRLNWEHFAIFTVASWLGGVILMLLRLAVASAAGHQLRRSATAVENPQILQVIRDQTRLLGFRVAPSVAWCKHIAVPVVVGILHPIILLPPALVTGLAPQQLSLILTHELAHIRRLDSLVNLLQRLVESVFFFHPAVWYVSKQITLERENCCDDLVVSTGTVGTDYAEALLRVAELCMGHRVPVTSLTLLSGNQSEIKRRVLRLLVPEPAIRFGGSALLLVLVATVGILFLVTYTVGPLAAQPQAESNQVAEDTTISTELGNDLIAILGEDRARVWGVQRRLLVGADGQQVFLTEAGGDVSIFHTQSLRRLQRFQAHEKRCLDIALATDGTRLISISLDGTARLWDLGTKPPTRLDSYQVIDSSAPTWLTMSVAKGGQLLALRSEEQISLVDILDDRIVFRAVIPQRGETVPFHYALSPTGRWLVTCERLESFTPIRSNGARYGYHDAKLVLWDVTHESPRRVSEVNCKVVERIGFRNDRDLIMEDPYFVPERQTRAWSIVNGSLRPREAIPSTSSSPFPSVVSADGNLMAVSNETGLQLLAFDGKSWLPHAKVESGPLMTAAFLEGDSLLVVSDHHLQRWDRIDGQYERRKPPTGHVSGVNGILFDARTNSLLTAARDSVREWNLAGSSGQTPVATTMLPYDSVEELWPWPNQKGFVLRRRVDSRNIVDGIRRNSSGVMLQRFRIDFGSDYRAACWSAAMHPSADVLATGHWDSHIRIWDVARDDPKEITAWKAHDGHVCDVVFSPDGGQLASVGWDRKTKLWPFTVNRIKEQAPAGAQIGEHADIVRSVAYSRDGKYLASGGEDGQILLWDLENEPLVARPLHFKDTEPVRNSLEGITMGSLEFSAGAELLSADGRGRVAIWSVTTGRVKKMWQLPGWVRQARYSPDEKVIATANADGTVYLLRASPRGG